MSRERDDWLGEIQRFLEQRHDDAPDAVCKEFASELWAMSAEPLSDELNDGRSSCDVCGATDRPTATVIAYGIETNACDKCRGVE